MRVWFAAFKNASHERHPRGGVLPKPLSIASAAATQAATRDIIELLSP
jgi:hypothetical protein